jgi:hypothetical protein
VANFETFTKRMVPLAKRPYITIQRRGTLSINRPAYDVLGAPEAVELLYDPERRIVGLRAVDAMAEHAYPVRGAGKSATSFLIAGTAFTKYYGITTDVSRRWPAEIDGGILVIDLRADGTEVTSNRRAKLADPSAT